MPDLLAMGQQLSVWFLPVIIAITVHEAAHAFVADKLGDDTARRLGRVSFNPIRHIDPFGTLVLPGLLVLLRSPFLFGWAKPVPVAFHRLNHPKRDMVWVALAGPAVNLAMALAAALLLHLAIALPGPVAEWVMLNLLNAVRINIVLAVFNMLPIPPLDGGRVLTGILPVPLAIRFAQTERYGLMILIGLLFIVPMIGDQLGLALNPVAVVLQPVIDTLDSFVMSVAGWQLG